MAVGSVNASGGRSMKRRMLDLPVHPPEAFIQRPTETVGVHCALDVFHDQCNYSVPLREGR